MVGRQEKSLHSRPWRQPFNSFCFQILSFFFLLFPFFIFVVPPWVSPDLHTYCSYIHFNSGCCNSCIFIARVKILARNGNERKKNKKKNSSKTVAKPQLKTNISTKKNSINMITYKWCKYSNKTDQISESNLETCLNKYTF